MKHLSSIFAPKRLNYPTTGLDIPPKRPRFSHTRLKPVPKVWSIGKGCLFTKHVDKSMLNTIEKPIILTQPFI